MIESSSPTNSKSSNLPDEDILFAPKHRYISSHADPSSPTKNYPNSSSASPTQQNNKPKMSVETSVGPLPMTTTPSLVSYRRRLRALENAFGVMIKWSTIISVEVL